MIKLEDIERHHNFEITQPYEIEWLINRVKKLEEALKAIQQMGDLDNLTHVTSSIARKALGEDC